MASDLDQLIEQFEQVAERGQTMTFAPRAKELQEATVAELQEFLEFLRRQKTQYVSRDDEHAANTILAMEVSLQAVLHELQMWLDLKNDAGESAWTNLVKAQYACGNAIDVREQLHGPETARRLEKYLQKLLDIERVVFPPQAFNSWGGRVGRRECTICHQSYDECPHIKGRAYMGKICGTIIADIEPVEVSVLVPVPANKHARMTHFSDEGGMRSKMTWRLEVR